MYVYLPLSSSLAAFFSLSLAHTLAFSFTRYLSLIQKHSLALAPQRCAGGSSESCLLLCSRQHVALHTVPRWWAGLCWFIVLRLVLGFPVVPLPASWLSPAFKWLTKLSGVCLVRVDESLISLAVVYIEVWVLESFFARCVVHRCGCLKVTYRGCDVHLVMGVVIASLCP